MSMNRGGRSVYNPIARSEDEEEEQQSNEGTTQTNSNLNSSGPQRASGRQRNYAPRVIAGDKEGAHEKEDTPLKVEKDLESTSTPKVTLDKDGGVEEIEDSGERVTVVILDPMQKKFPIVANSSWTIQRFKLVGAKVHKVPPPSQRLIYRGKMLEDSKTLKDAGIDKNDVIVHLFPKPRVVVTSSASNITETSGDEEEEGGAHVPSIYLDEEEQERRGQILVLGSVEIAEAQNNVKILSLLLLVMCSMRLLALFSIAMGVAEEPAHQDDTTPPSNSTHGGDPTDYEVRSWGNQDYYDLAVSGVGFYVATLGMKATTDNTSRQATAYLIGTVIAGIGWNIWNMFMFAFFIQEEAVPTDDDEMVPLTRDDYVTVALFTVAMPLGVWFVCCARAWQFRQLIEEAEQEAAERIQSQLTLSEGDEETNDDELFEISTSNSRPTIV